MSVEETENHYKLVISLQQSLSRSDWSGINALLENKRNYDNQKARHLEVLGLIDLWVRISTTIYCACRAYRFLKETNAFSIFPVGRDEFPFIEDVIRVVSSLSLATKQ
jgi:hypothetical protein